ncbi:hypothetical protein SBF1_1110037 [Candidatus Desulfosporosinus infrequens]|uniref:Uncharacterized protein n=1 Tax=Candidatus Desulfosporosinus infrequens TaxID=2043169 RepID=A0A2U3JYM6_9FIRM|nr:hypothetical protein SBF1_1110037 [Candidatus Desulfosporosinus infrequens]
MGCVSAKKIIIKLNSSQKCLKTNVEDMVPILAVEVLAKRKITDCFSDRDLETILNVGLNAISSIIAGKFQEEFSYQGDLVYKSISIEQIVDSVLAIIIAENERIESELLLKSFRSGFSTAIQEGETEEEKLALFVQEFCFHLLYFLILESTIEALHDVYPEVSMRNLEKLIRDSARRIVNINLIEDIQKLITGQINVSNLVSIFKDNAIKVKVGEF